MAIQPERPRARNETALVLVTLTPEQEARRKILGSPRQTCAVFEQLQRQWRRLGRTLRQADLLVCTPADTLGGRRVDLRQRGADLGAVLRNATDDAFRLGYRNVLLIGNDAPSLSAEYIAAAIRRIQRLKPAAVLGPAVDGGFVLLGLNRNDSRLFRDIDWGTSRVAAQVLARLGSAGFAVQTLPRLLDIDDPSSLGLTLTPGSASGVGRIASAMRERLRRIFDPPPIPADVARVTPAILLLLSRPSLRGPPV